MSEALAPRSRHMRIVTSANAKSYEIATVADRDSLRSSARAPRHILAKHAIHARLPPLEAAAKLVEFLQELNDAFQAPLTARSLRATTARPTSPRAIPIQAIQRSDRDCLFGSLPERPPASSCRYAAFEERAPKGPAIDRQALEAVGRPRSAAPAAINPRDACCGQEALRVQSTRTGRAIRRRDQR